MLFVFDLDKVYLIDILCNRCAIFYYAIIMQILCNYYANIMQLSVTSISGSPNLAIQCS